MSETQELKLNITAKDEASPVIRKLMSEIQKLNSLTGKLSATTKINIGGQSAAKSISDDIAKSTAAVTKSLRTRVAGEREISAVQNRRERDRRVGESRAMADLRRSMAFTSRMAAQRIREEREVERARVRTEQQHAAGVRRQIGLDRYRLGLRARSERQEAAAEQRAQRDEDRRRSQGRRDLRSAGNHANDAGHRIMGAAHGITVGSAIGAGIVAKIAETGLGARSRADTAEANLRMFGGLNRNQVDAARSGWINRAAIDNGFRPADAINAVTEALKAGIPDTAAPDVTKSIMGAVAGLDLNVADTTKLVGRLSTLTQDPKLFDPKQIDEMLNGIAVVAKVTAADPRELVSSLRRGAGVLGSSKMSVSDLTAFTGVGISTGMQEGKAGTFMDFLVNEMVNAKNARGLRREDLEKGTRMAGLGSLNQVSRDAANNPTEMLLKLFERMSEMDPQKAGQVASLIGMREWRGEMLQMMRGTPMLRQTVKAGRDPKNKDHLKQARDERLGTLSGLRNQLVATFDLAWEAIGSGIEDIVREIGRFFLDLGKSMNFDVIRAHVKTLIDGFVDGLGFTSITQMLEKAFGKPNFSTVNAFFRFAQGFGQGIREVIDGVLGFLKVFTGEDADAETMGKWTARIIGFAAALSFASPFLGVLAGLGGAVLAFGFALSKIGSLGSLSGLIRGLAKGFGLGLAAEIGANRGAIVTFVLNAIKSMWAAIKEGLIEGFSIKNILSVIKNEAIPAPLQRWLDGDKATSEEEKAKPAEEKLKQKKRKKKGLPDDNDWLNLIQKQSFSGYEDHSEAVERLNDSVKTMGARFQLAALSGPGSIASMASSASSGFTSGGSVASTSNDAARKFGKNFFTPDMKVPGWFGGGGGSASSNPANSSASARMLDAIAGTESGKASYNAVLGNGRYGTPSKPVSQMTLDEAFRFGRQIKARHGSSSALGRYQIVGNTMRAAQRALGISGDATFDPAMQDRMTRWIARSQGLGAWEGLKHNPRAMAEARAAMAAGGAKDTPVGANVPSIAGTVPDLSGPLGSTKGLRIKSGTALAGGATNPAIIAAAQMIQNGNVAGGLNRFTAFNDLYHKGTGSKHASGLAGDFTLNDARQSSVAAEQVRRMFRSAGLSDEQFKVIDEYKNPSGRSTGGHIHYQLNSALAAAKYAQAIQARTLATVESTKRTVAAANAASGTKIDVGEGMTSTGWQKGVTAMNADAVRGVPAKRVDDAMGRVPLPPRRPAGLGGGGAGGGPGGGSTVIHVNGAGENPEAVAQKVENRLSDRWNHYHSSLEPELV